MTLTRRAWFQRLAAAAGVAAGFTSPGGTAERPDRIVRSARPEDFEMPLDGFRDWITPAERFFVRSHHYTPTVDLAAWRLNISGEVAKPAELTMDDLRKLPRAELVGVMECAGNGRAFYDPPVPGLQWAWGAVANGRWAGARLADVLSRAGLKGGAREVLFDGADVPPGSMPKFQRSIPIRKALHPDTLLAYELNGAPLPPSNGFPLRVVAPGWASDSWVKWLTAIRVLDQEFDGYFMKTAYRRPERAVAPGSTVDPATMKPVMELAVKSVIASPLEGERLGPGPVHLSGAAWTGGLAQLMSVEVSLDRGRSWRLARLGRDASRYAWRLWEFDWTPPASGYYTVMARARDSLGNMQPFVQEWNPSGYLYNVVPRVSFEVGTEAGTQRPVGEVVGGVADAPPDVYRTACVACHGEDVIAQQRLTRAQWDREVTKMIQWGAPVAPEQKSGLVDYLAGQYGPRRGR